MNAAHLSAATLVLATGLAALAQDKPSAPTPLSALLEEARRNNAQLIAAEHAWRAATHIAQQVTTLPDPQLTVQQFSVGTPRPFAGFTNSDFAYIGVGASQELPYPGKLHLKGQVAAREAGAQQAQWTELRASILEQVKVAYLHLAYLQQTLNVLERTGTTLKQLAETELSQYRVGEGNQADVLKAELERTKLLREVTMHHAQMAQYQAELKLLLHRSQESTDIKADDLKLTPLAYSAAELLSLVQSRNPAVQSERAVLNKQAAQLQSAERARKPDFSLGYMYEKTDSRYRDYYMLTVGITLPRRRRVNAEIAEAAEMEQKAKASLDEQLQQQLSEVQKEYVSASSSAELLTEYKDGLLPQAESVLRAHLAAFQSGKGELSAALVAVADALNLERESAQALLDHEISIAHLEMLTGATLR
jgi:outer membrane protein TolC